MNDVKKTIAELHSATEWFAEHGRNTNTAIIGICEGAIEVINRQQAEIERLEALSERLGNDVDLKLKYIYELEEKAKTAKSEARKEFAERLKNSFGYGWLLGSAVKTHIDNLLEEMEKENK